MRSSFNGGILTVFDVGSGEQLYRERLTAGTGFSGSAVAANGMIYFSGENGEVFVVAAGLDYELLATGNLGERSLRSDFLRGWWEQGRDLVIDRRGDT